MFAEGDALRMAKKTMLGAASGNQLKDNILTTWEESGCPCPSATYVATVNRTVPANMLVSIKSTKLQIAAANYTTSMGPVIVLNRTANATASTSGSSNTSDTSNGSGSDVTIDDSFNQTSYGSYTINSTSNSTFNVTNMPKRTAVTVPNVTVLVEEAAPFIISTWGGINCSEGAVSSM